MMQAFTRVAEEESVAALWKGSPAVLTGMVMENAFAFGINEQLKRVFPEVQRGQAHVPSVYETVRPLVLGAVTGALTSVVLIPSEVVKVRAQMEDSVKVAGRSSPTSLEMMNLVWRRQGMRGMFAGFDAQIARDGLFYSLFFGSYEVCAGARGGERRWHCVCWVLGTG